MQTSPPLTSFSDGVGEPKKPPCVSCHDSGSECVLTKSRRGGNFRYYRTGPGMAAADSVEAAPTHSDNVSSSQEAESPVNEGSVVREDSGDLLAMELRNPSDALQILAISGYQPPKSPNAATNPGMQGSTETILSQPHRTRLHAQSTSTIFDDYELVQRGLLRPSLVSELLLKFVIHFLFSWHRLTVDLDMPATTTHTVPSSPPIYCALQAQPRFRNQTTSF